MVNGDSVRIDLSSSGYLGLSSWYNRLVHQVVHMLIRNRINRSVV